MQPHELQNIIAKLESKLARQQLAYNQTTEQIKLLENSGLLESPNYVGAVTSLRQLAVKQLRQQNAVIATEGYLKVLRSTTGVKTATK